jgi:hypothetical protein
MKDMRGVELAIGASHDALAGVLQRYRGCDRVGRVKRKPGRPLKRSDEYFRNLLARHSEIEAWYLTRTDRRPKSDRELYTDYFAAQFVAAGERAARATDKEFQGALKTLLNELSEARRIERANPENPSISGKS